jgi:uncharacterized protein (TIGR00255 family)
MIRSMTGFGKAAGSFDGREVTIEIVAVNHRYLDASVRLPGSWSILEPDVKQALRDQLNRGKLSVYVSCKRSHGGATIRFDAEVARQYIEASKELARMVGTMDTITVDTVASLDGVFVQEEPEDDLDQVRAELMALVDDAIGRLNEMRVGEGAVLARDVRARIGLLREALGVIEERLPELNRHHESRLRSRIDDLKADVALTEERLALEVALLAEKADVTEEVVRLKAHLDHMEELLDAKDPVGRRLDFLLQELQREVNTLGVKTRDSDVARSVLDMKAEVEKIREQVQNIE